VKALAASLLLLACGCLTTAPAPTPVAPAPRVEAPPPAVQDTGWQFPLADGVLPTEPELLPNAGREYRSGVHQGVDLFFVHQDGELVACGTPVLNARTGTVSRADREWQPMSVKDYDTTTAGLRAGAPPSTERAAQDDFRLDRLRGRQIWVTCDDGTLIRYCHLLSIDPSVAVGLKIARGVVIGKVGNSGTADGAAGTAKNCHLHFEVWPTPDAFLGKGMSSAAARKAYAKLFGIE